MGEKKRREMRMRAEPCICGSGEIASHCCAKKGAWRKNPAQLHLRNTGYSGSHPRCYLRDLQTCCDVLSEEHFISRTVLEAIGEKEVAVSGMPWVGADVKRPIPIDRLVSNCLCEAHNHALSPLDAVAGQFYRALKDVSWTIVGRGGITCFRAMMSSGGC